MLPLVYHGVMFRARAYADGLEHPRLWGIAGTVSAAPGRGAKARRASSTMTAAVWAKTPSESDWAIIRMGDNWG